MQRSNYQLKFNSGTRYLTGSPRFSTTYVPPFEIKKGTVSEFETIVTYRISSDKWRIRL